jgi:SAM-dependent methyltransferase
MTDDYKGLIRERILTDKTFIRAIFSGRRRGFSLDWTKVTVRPVQIKDVSHLQFSYFDAFKDITKNYTGEEAESKLDELLELPFKNIHVQTKSDNFQLNITKKGKLLFHQTKADKTAGTIDLSHDRKKKRILSDTDPAPFLEMIGIMTKVGKIKADKQKKFVQINEFLRLIDETQAFGDGGESPVSVVDFGCGNAYLTFAIYHYLNHILNLNACVTGIDIKAELIERHREKAKGLGWDRLTFEVGRIADFQPNVPPDIVLALHACDTATDDALAQGIRWGSRLIVSAPCCQHELQEQLCQLPVPEPFQSVARYGLLNERLGDILTDTFRAAILRIVGYHTDVIQFVSTEHSAKNLMIRAVKAHPPGIPLFIKEYLDLKTFWRVSPYLEKLLSPEYEQWLGNPVAQ